MYKANALARQKPPEPKVNWLDLLRFEPIYWIILSILGGTLGYIVQSFNDKSLRDLLESTGLSVITGPRMYFDYFWALYFILKIFSSYLIYSKSDTFRSSKSKSSKSKSSKSTSLKSKSIEDLALIILFFIEYQAVKYISLTYNFKLSGHCLILTIGSSLLHSEGRLSAKHLKQHSIQPLTKSLLLLNYYFFTWTCAVYHSLPESLSGTLLGLLTLLLIRKLLPR